MTNVEYVSILAWLTRENVGKIGHRPQFEVTKQTYPIMLFTQLKNGWAVTPYRTPAALKSSCYHALFVSTPHRQRHLLALSGPPNVHPRPDRPPCSVLGPCAAAAPGPDLPDPGPRSSVRALRSSVHA